ncbi:hypothetical protein [Paraburkholderia sediminicola]|uniref:hypothetical protein n=1 Tax=Paraburkholderia sediminicola TaxID=458836 RepID=UPI0038B76A2A
MEEKVVISLISVAAGWFLSQGTAFFKDLWEAKKMRAGLLTELEDIENQLQRVAMIHTRQLQIFALKGMEPTAALPVQNMFFKQYFKEAFSHLNRSQRVSYQLIHSSLDNLNKMQEGLAKFAEESYNEIKTEPDQKTQRMIEMWGDRVIALYKTTMDVRWHIDYHLRNPKCPTFDLMGRMHESYVKFEHELDQEVRLIIERAKTFKKEDFEQIYNADAFTNKRPNAV